MKLDIVARSTCSGGQCPTLYMSEDGRYFVQGNKADATLSENLTEVPAHEGVVELSSDMIAAIKRLG